MTKIKHFKKGGVHPNENKGRSSSKEIKNADYPKIVKIPLQQHLGSPAKCIVKVGDIVNTGDVIAQASGIMSSNIHSSIDGTVKDIVIENSSIGIPCEMVVIEFRGEFQGLIGKYKQNIEWRTLDRNTILQKIRDAGIVGLGGAAFPTHIKINPPKDKTIDFLIANGAECEPFLTCDHRLMIEKAVEILEGLKILMTMMDINKAIIAIENNKKDAIKLMEHICNKEDNINVVPLRVRYPQGAEKQIIEAIFKKEVPSGGLPMDVGCVVSNVGTLYSVYEAVVHDKVLTERIVTVSGNIVKNPGNYKTKIGTLIKDLLGECLLSETPKKVIAGGPMMGFSQLNLNAPITKGTSGVLVFSENELDDTPEGQCIRCASCVRACPMYLMPNSMKELCNANLFEDVKKIGLLDCIECGSCSYVCPSKIPLVQYFRYAKVMLRIQKKYSGYKIPVIPLS